MFFSEQSNVIILDDEDEDEILGVITIDWILE